MIRAREEQHSFDQLSRCAVAVDKDQIGRGGGWTLIDQIQSAEIKTDSHQLTAMMRLQLLDMYYRVSNIMMICPVGSYFFFFLSLLSTVSS